MSEEEIKKYLSAMRVIDYNKEGFVCGEETITRALDLIEKKDMIINEMIGDIYKRTHIRTKECNFYVDEDKCLKYASCIECIFNYFERIVENEINQENDK